MSPTLYSPGKSMVSQFNDSFRDNFDLPMAQNWKTYNDHEPGSAKRIGTANNGKKGLAPYNVNHLGLEAKSLPLGSNYDITNGSPGSGGVLSTKKTRIAESPVNIHNPKLGFTYSPDRKPLKGIDSSTAPAIVISSIASYQADYDYNYLPSEYIQNLETDKPLTAKDRARHGMLRTMLRNQLEVTRPNWPKHPMMRSTDRELDSQMDLLDVKNPVSSKMSEFSLGSPSLRRNQVKFNNPGGVMRGGSNHLLADSDMERNQNEILQSGGTKAFRQICGNTTGSMLEPGVKPFGGSFGIPGTADSEKIKTLTSSASLNGSSSVIGGRLPSPSERNIEIMKSRETTTPFLQVYARPATTSMRGVGRNKKGPQKRVYGGSATKRPGLKSGGVGG